MAEKSRIAQIYRTSLHEAGGFLNKVGFEIVMSTVKPESKGENIEIRLTQPLVCLNWPYRAGSTERIDILADIIETIRLSDSTCVKSRLLLNYFRHSNEKERVACDALHYDFEEPVQSQHPICHAQNSGGIMDPMPEEYRYKIDTRNVTSRFRAIRIPTAFVNFAGLFAKLTADHMDPDTCREFWDSCGSVLEQIPDHAKNDISERICDSSSLRCQHWYPEESHGG